MWKTQHQKIMGKLIEKSQMKTEMNRKVTEKFLAFLKL